MDPSFLKGVMRAVPTPVNGMRIVMLLSRTNACRRLEDVGHGEPSAAALIHRAATSAPLANPRRSRAACVNSIVSDGPSNPTVWMPGIAPARVDDMSIGSAVAGA